MTATSTTDITNDALQIIGTRTTVTDAEMSGNTSNEAIQSNLVITKLRDQLLRMAPWNCAKTTQSLTYITSTPGTPENTSAGTTLWQKGQPTPPWTYMYQYPVDCLRPCWIVPQFATGFASSVPITTAITGGAPHYWTGPPVRFVVGVDQFYPVTAAAVVAGGSGYAADDYITLEQAAASIAPVGAPVVLQVSAILSGAVSTVNVVSVVPNQTAGGSYFDLQSGTIAQGSTTGSGTGATFTLTQGAKDDQRVILTNQEDAVLTFIKQVTNIDVMDPLFIDAWTHILAARLCKALTEEDSKTINMYIQIANAKVMEARAADANEGLTINDVVPDWIRNRGITFPTNYGWSPSQFDWGSLFPMY